MTTTEPGLAGPGRNRLDAIDLLRGLVMVVMALDHVRDYFSDAGVDPTDLSKATPLLFLTRWVTHFCAPVFVFLAGTGAFLSGARGKTRAQLSVFLLTRGLWLVVLELTLVRLGWCFNFDYRFLGVGVIWVIGCSMVVLSVLVFLPLSVITGLGVFMICFHNLLDGLSADQVGLPEGLWVILHGIGAQGTDSFVVNEVMFATGYKLIPWAGVMAAGYGFGAVWLLERPQRRKWLLGLGTGLTAAFILLRAVNVYGDSVRPWILQDEPLFTALSFLNCHKYPPSLHYLLMTLGPAILALALFDRDTGPLGRLFVVFGRVPLFYYLIHIPLIHALAVALDQIRFGWSPLVDKGFWDLRLPELPQGYGVSLPVVYLIWLGVIVTLYPLCRWFAGVKQRHRDVWWLSYL
jgi:uncharacterized membrane protein